MIFTEGDRARYHGGVLLAGGACLMAGDVITVTKGNEDYDDDVTVEFDGQRFTVAMADLEWMPA